MTLTVGQRVYSDRQWWRVTLVNESRAHIVPEQKRWVVMPQPDGTTRGFWRPLPGLDVSPESVFEEAPSGDGGIGVES